MAARVLSMLLVLIAWRASLEPLATIGPYAYAYDYAADSRAADTTTVVSMWSDAICARGACVECDGVDEAMGWCSTGPRLWSLWLFTLGVIATVRRPRTRGAAMFVTAALLLPWHIVLVDARAVALPPYWWFAGSLALNVFVRTASRGSGTLRCRSPRGSRTDALPRASLVR